MALRPSIIEQRGEQMLPVLNALEIERVRRFGECRSFATGEALAAIGQIIPRLMIILAGHVDPAGQNDHQARADLADGEERRALGE